MRKNIPFHCFLGIIFNSLALVYSVESVIFSYKEIFVKNDLYPIHGERVIPSSVSPNKVECFAICSNTDWCSMIVVSLEKTSNGLILYTCNFYRITNSTNLTISDMSEEIRDEIWYKTEKLDEFMHDLDDAKTTTMIETTTEAVADLTSQGQIGCPSPFILLDVGCYHSDINEMMSWNDVLAYCAGKSGSQLAQLRSEQVEYTHMTQTG